MSLAFQPRVGVPQRQNFERPDPRVLFRTVDDERRHEARLQGDLAAREALAAATSKPQIGIVALVRAGAAERIFEHRRADPSDGRGIDGLPERMTQWIIVPQP